MFDLKGRVAIVTGASSGLGVQMAKALARQGADIAILARRKDKMENVSKEIEALGVKCIPVVCDVTSTESIQNAIDTVVKTYGKIDILVNNAGAGGVVDAEKMPDEVWEKDISVDLTGVFKVARAVAKVMIEKKYGRIINIASMYGMVGNNTSPAAAYHAAKGGVVNLTRALAAEWGKYNITVNAICPGFFPTELTKPTLDTAEFQAYVKMAVPVGRYGQEGELDPCVVYLASDEASYTTGTTQLVDGGYTSI